MSMLGHSRRFRGWLQDHRAAAGDLGSAQSHRRRGDVLSVWKNYYATDTWGGPLPCGHYVPEEAPDETYAHFVRHFKG